MSLMWRCTVAACMAPTFILSAFSLHLQTTLTQCVLILNGHQLCVVCPGCVMSPSFVLLVCCWVVGVCSGNYIFAEGAKALATSLAKLTQLQTLNVGSKWSVFGALCRSLCVFGALCVCVPPLCGFGLCALSCVCNDVCCCCCCCCERL